MSNVVYIVMNGMYDKSIEGVFSEDKLDAAIRYAEALQEGSYYILDLNKFDMPDFPYRVDYRLGDERGLAWLVFDRWSDEVTGSDNFYTVYVRANSQSKAEEKGIERICAHIKETDNGKSKV